MARIEIEESALDSIKAMNHRLQEERDELLAALKNAVDDEPNALFAYGAKELIARCNSSPKVME